MWWPWVAKGSGTEGLGYKVDGSQGELKANLSYI